MSKEQTPITAEEFYINNSTLSDIELMEQYAQVKVLEALEREREEIEKRREQVARHPHMKHFVKTSKLKELDTIINQLRNRSKTKV